MLIKFHNGDIRKVIVLVSRNKSGNPPPKNDKTKSGLFQKINCHNTRDFKEESEEFMNSLK